MSDKNDPFKDFIAKSTSEELKKPIDEFNAILGEIESKKGFTLFPGWLMNGAVAASLVLVVGFSVNYFQADESMSDDEIAFLFDNFNDDYFDSDDDYIIELEGDV